MTSEHPTLSHLLKNKKEILTAPGASNAITARLVEEAGFPAVYITGAGISNSMLAAPDIGLLSYKEVIDQVRYICDAVNIFVIADADTGFGNVTNVRRTIREFEAAGVSAIQIEDQVMPKKCGHFEGKEIIESEQMIQKIKAAAAARKSKDFLIIARTDARSVIGLDCAIERGRQYQEAGADIVFIEAPQTVEELQKVGEQLADMYLVANMVEHGKTPLLANRELYEMGYDIVLYANVLQRRAIKAMQDTLIQLKADNHTRHISSDIIDMKERNRLTRLDEYQQKEQEFS